MDDMVISYLFQFKEGNSLIENDNYQSQVMSVTHQKKYEGASEPNEETAEKRNATASKEGACISVEQKETTDQPAEQGDENALINATSAGAATASEIFRILQATRGKEEVTVELAKILSVLQVTLQPNDSSSSSDCSSSDSSDSDEKDPEPRISEPPKDLDVRPKSTTPLGKPPKHPNLPLLQSKSANDMSQRIGPEIQQRIKELGAVKPGSGKEEMGILSKILVTLLCSCRSTSASTELKKIIRQFKDAANEASDEVTEDLMSLSGSCQRTSAGRRRKTRSRKSSVNSSNSFSEAESLTNTLTPCNTDSKSSGTEDEGGDGVKPTPRLQFKVVVDAPEDRVEMGEDQLDPNVSFTISLPSKQEYDGEKADEDEWEWEDDDDAKCELKDPKRHDSTNSSQEVSLSDDKSSASSTVRKLLNEMECGAYNSDSLYSPGHSGQSINSNEATENKSDNESDGTAEWSSADESNQPVFAHLQETFNVLNGAYKIITGEVGYTQEQNVNGSFISSTTKATVQPVLNSSMSCSATIDKKVLSRSQTKQISRSESRQKPRPESRMSLRSCSRMSAKGDEDSDEWEYEYFYEDEEEGEATETIHEVAKEKVKVVEVKAELPKEHIIPIIVEEEPEWVVTGQRKVSRPNSRQSSRPGSRNHCRMKGSLNGVKGEDERDWEWEHYHDEEGEDELRNLSPTLTTAPTTRATSPFPNSGLDQAPKKVIVQPLSCTQEMTNSPDWEELGRVSDLKEPLTEAQEAVHGDDLILDPTRELSVLLAAKYLGQTAQNVAPVLPTGFVENPSPRSLSRISESSRVKEKKQKKHKKHKKSEDPERRRKKKYRVSVKQLVDKLEPKLFQDIQAGTKMVMEESAAISAIKNSQHNPMSPKNVSRVFRNDKNHMQVVQGGLSTVVTMRNNPYSVPRRKKISPSESSEAYGTGSTTSDATERNDNEVVRSKTGSKDGSERHSRLFRLLQDSDYTDSEMEGEMQSLAPEIRPGSDLDSLGSIRSGIERKHSFKSNDSEESFGQKISPPSMRRELAAKRLGINLGSFTVAPPQDQVQHHHPFFPLTPSSSEVSTPSSPTFAFAPPTKARSPRVWSYLSQEFAEGGSQRGSEEPASPQKKLPEIKRNSPRLEMDLMDLAHLPPAPTFNTRNQPQGPSVLKFSGYGK